MTTHIMQQSKPALKEEQCIERGLHIGKVGGGEQTIGTTYLSLRYFFLPLR